MALATEIMLLMVIARATLLTANDDDDGRADDDDNDHADEGIDGKSYVVDDEVGGDVDGD